MRREDVVITRFPTRKTGALLAYLAYYPRMGMSREALADLFWPDHDPAAARNSLRVALNSLRRQIEEVGEGPGSLLVADRTTVRLRPGSFTTDVADFERALDRERTATNEEARREHLMQAVDLYRGPLMSGWYEEWVALEQTRLAEVYAGLLRRLTSVLIRRGDFDLALDFARRAVHADPLREEAHRILMRVHAAMGNPTEAILQYRNLETILRTQMGAQPSGATRELLKQITLASDSTESVRSATPIVTSQPAASGRSTPEVPSESQPAQPLTRFFGREEEIGRLRELLMPGQGERLVSLTGIGGVGKTRLATELVRSLKDTSSPFEGRCWMASLAGMVEAEPAASTIAATLSLDPPRDIPPFDHLVNTLREKTGAAALLVLDHLDDLLEAGGGATLVQRLLERVPGLYCLITARRRVDVAGERELPLGPLPVPSEQEEPSPDWPGIALFLDRARAVRPDLESFPRNGVAVAELCRRLDGLPLALELAAAWARVLTPAQMLARLSGRFGLLVTERSDMAQRHRSLRAVMEESRQLLNQDAESFWARLSVFRNGWTLEAAQAVCATEIDNNDDSVALETLELLDTLQRRSLVVAEETPAGLRFRMLETVRDFADSLLKADEKERITAAHAAFFLRLAEQAAPHLATLRETDWLGRLNQERDNLRAAATWFVRADMTSTEEALRFGAALWRYWYADGLADEGVRYLEQALAREGSAEEPPNLRASVLHGAGRLLASGGNPLRACALLQASLALQQADPALSAADGDFRDVAIRSLVATATELGIASRSCATPPLTRQAYETVLRVRAGGEDLWAQACALSEIAQAAYDEGDREGAERALRESLRLRQILGDRWGVRETTAALTYLVENKGKHNLADRGSIASAFLQLGHVAAEQGDFNVAVPLLKDAFNSYKEENDLAGAALALERLGVCAASTPGQERFAEETLAEASSLRQQASLPPTADALTATLRLHIANAPQHYGTTAD